MIPSLLITGPSTGAGKTFVNRALAAALRARGLRVAALKPVETGVDPDPLDALALARAAGQPDLAHQPGFYRARPPLAPFAAELEGGTELDLLSMVTRVRELAAQADALLVEGAGGLLTPLDLEHDVSHLARRLDLPLLLVARDQLGVISHVLTCAEAARTRALRVVAVILSQHPADTRDPSRRTNQRILQARLPCPVRTFRACDDADESLAAAAESSGLIELLGLA